jgi:hypothetical protein
MSSHYYLCTITDSTFSEQQLGEYEADLKLTPVWITIKDAIEKNELILNKGKDAPRWTYRDTYFLKELLEEQHSTNTA